MTFIDGFDALLPTLTSINQLSNAFSPPPSYLPYLGPLTSTFFSNSTEIPLKQYGTI
jgi:hypothetical protein